MDIQKLQFFDNNGYNLNFDWNEKHSWWEGNIYLPKVSVGLYANTTIYVLEEVGGHLYFPMGPGKITFAWDRLNKFVDEFFMFNFDETYIIKETSALIYTPNDGPDGNTLIINRFDEYEIPLNNSNDLRALPIHIAFMAHEKYDATTYNRTLIMSYNGQIIAKIKFYAETVEEDERLKIWNANLGYNITPEDTMIFYKSDIKEYRPDYMLLNEKRKELMMEGSQIYPYIGSYKAIINAIKFFGYDNLYIIEYWRNVNPSDENFGKIYHSSKYSLTKRETLRVGARNIVLPNKDYKKINALALVYTINKPTGEVDEWELPIMKENFTYTIEEALIKLFALRKKLNKEFMPGSSRIIDIIGEGNYFGIQAITKIHDSSTIEITKSHINVSFELNPSKHIYITDNEYYDRYINFVMNDESFDRIDFRNQMLSDVLGENISTYSGDSLQKDHHNLTNKENCKYYQDFYQRTEVDHTLYKEIMNNDDYPFLSETGIDDFRREYEYTDQYNPYERFSAKVVLKNTSFDSITFDDSQLKFDCSFSSWEQSDSADDMSAYICENMQVGKTHIKENSGTYSNITFNNIDTVGRPDKISWTITMSKPDYTENGIGYQYDEDLKNVGIIKTYEYRDLNPLAANVNVISGVQDIDDFNEFYAELPYLGYYDVTLEIGYDGGNGTMVNTQKVTKTKCIKVEPYNIELIGFYYDARNLPEKLQYVNDENSTMYQFIKSSIENMHGWAVSERNTLDTPIPMSMPFYTAEGEMVGTGPYYNKNVDDEWYLADNLTYEMGLLKPLMKYTRYIRSGVDVKPFTWFLLGYEYSKIAGKINPHWRIENLMTGNVNEWDGRYLTLLLKKEGNYQVTLDLEDKNGNKYSTTRNIIVVSKDANYKLYQTFKKDYDYLTEQALLKEAREYNSISDYTIEEETTDDEVREVNVRINGFVREYPQKKDVNVYGTVRFEKDIKNVYIEGVVKSEQTDVVIDGKVRFAADEQDVIVDGKLRYEDDPDAYVYIDVEGSIYNNTHDVDVIVDGIVREQEIIPVTVDGTIEPGSDAIPVAVDGTIESGSDTIPVAVDGTVESGSESIPVNVDGTIESGSDTIPVNVDGLVEPGSDAIPVAVDGTIESGSDTIPVNVDGTIDPEED